MLDMRKRSSLRWNVRFLLCVMTFLHTAAWCYGNSCPVHGRPPRAERPPQITEADLQEACEKAKVNLHKNYYLERRLFSAGRIVNLNTKTSESVHPQASAPPIIRKMEESQWIFQEVTVFLAQRLKLTPVQVACGLQNYELKGTCLEDAVMKCTANQTTECNYWWSLYRTPDGTCNNVNNPTWGSSFSCFNRLLLPEYSANEGLRKSSCGCGDLPPARNISLNVHSHLDARTYDITHMHMFFGQLLDHDLTATAQSLTVNDAPIQCCPPVEQNHRQCAPMTISPDDLFYKQYSTTCMNFVRSAICPICTLGTRTQINQVTAFIDASFVYGSTLEQTKSLRSPNGGGELLVQWGYGRELLPASDRPHNDQCSVPQNHQKCFRAGDARVNEHSMLASLQTLFLREHNRIARELNSTNPKWDDDKLFQEAKKICGAIMQVIVYKEYLPIVLGKQYMDTYGLTPTGIKWYINSGNPSLFTEFSIAFRYGHTLINSLFVEIPRRTDHAGHLLRDIYLQPFELYNGQMEPLLRGAAKSSAQRFDRHCVPDITNFLYKTPGEAAGMDLPAFNIQRGRDHGIPGYVKYARLCGLEIYTFDDLKSQHIMCKANVDLLRTYYDCLEDVDLFTGIIAENHLPDALLGPTGQCIVGLQFYHLQKYDRYYFENVWWYHSFTYDQIAELMKMSLAKLICYNTDIYEIQPEVMRFPFGNNTVRNCWEIPGIDLGKWAEPTDTTSTPAAEK